MLRKVGAEMCETGRSGWVVVMMRSDSPEPGRRREAPKSRLAEGPSAEMASCRKRSKGAKCRIGRAVACLEKAEWVPWKLMRQSDDLVA